MLWCACVCCGCLLEAFRGQCDVLVYFWLAGSEWVTAVVPVTSLRLRRGLLLIIDSNTCSLPIFIFFCHPPVCIEDVLWTVAELRGFASLSLSLSLFSLSSGIFPPTLALFSADLTLYLLTCLKFLQDFWQLIIKLEAIYQEYTAVKQGFSIVLPRFGLKSSSMPGSTGWFPESSDLCASLAVVWRPVVQQPCMLISSVM